MSNWVPQDNQYWLSTIRTCILQEALFTASHMQLKIAPTVLMDRHMPAVQVALPPPDLDHQVAVVLEEDQYPQSHLATIAIIVWLLPLPLQPNLVWRPLNTQTFRGGAPMARRLRTMPPDLNPCPTHTKKLQVQQKGP